MFEKMCNYVNESNFISRIKGPWGPEILVRLKLGACVNLGCSLMSSIKIMIKQNKLGKVSIKKNIKSYGIFHTGGGGFTRFP